MHRQGPQVSRQFEALRDMQGIHKACTFAQYTIPSLMADANKPQGHADILTSDYQSDGALLVNNLTAKLAGALFPSGRSFFKLDTDPELRAAAEASGTSLEDLARGSAEMERQATAQLFKNASLSKLHRILKLAIVTGDCLVLRDIDRSKFRVWNRWSYAVRRKPTGEIVEIILKESVRLDSLPEEVQEAVQKESHRALDSTTELYTHVQYKAVLEGEVAKTVVEVQQYVDDIPIGEVSEYPEHLCPYFIVAWNVPDGEHYGRGYVEEYAGAFAKLSMLSEQLGLYELESLSLLNLVDESSGGIVDDYQKADIGEFLPGKADGVHAYERGDYNKIQTIQNGLIHIVQQLSRAFMYTGQQRNVERVTAEEVRHVAAEAETLLGGAYSVLAEVLQAPLAYLCMYEVALNSGSQELLYELLTRQFQPEIVTGIPALAQAADTQNLLQAVQEAQLIIPALSELTSRYDTDKLMEQIMINNSVDTTSFEKSPEQLAQEAQEAQQMQQIQEQMQAQEQEPTEEIQ